MGPSAKILLECDIDVRDHPQKGHVTKLTFNLPPELRGLEKNVDTYGGEHGKLIVWVKGPVKLTEGERRSENLRLALEAYSAVIDELEDIIQRDPDNVSAFQVKQTILNAVREKYEALVSLSDELYEL